MVEPPGTTLEPHQRNLRGVGPTGWIRLFAAAVIAANAASLVAAANRYFGSRGLTTSDYDQVWFASRAMLRGADPYAAAQAYWVWGTLYQPPAFLLNVPLALLPLDVARIIFAAAGAGILAWSVTRTHWWSLAVFASGCFMVAIVNVQWSPWLLAGIFCPALSIVWIAKPSLGLALWIGWPRASVAVSSALLLIVGTLLVPDWMDSWRVALQTSVHVQAAVTRPYGWVLLLALLRWRRPEARFLAALALVPHTESWPDLLIIFAVAQRRWEWAALSGLTTAALAWGWGRTDAPTSTADFGATIAGQWPGILGLVYVPALIMVLMRPNSGEAPPWLASLRRVWRPRPAA